MGYSSYGSGYDGYDSQQSTTDGKRLRKGLFAKVLIGFIVASNIAFTVACMWIFLAVGAVPDTLIYCWFAFTTGELWALAFVKDKKLKLTKKEDNYAGHIQDGPVQAEAESGGNEAAEDKDGNTDGPVS